MKFLGKNANSNILEQNLTYKKGNSKNNKQLRIELLKEQKQFCAYTEKYISGIDSDEVEHFDASKKEQDDDYYNYYAVIRHANQIKMTKDNSYVGATFFESLFFHNNDEFSSRIVYCDNNFYEEINEDDSEAKELISFLGFNDNNLFVERKKHIERLKNIFENAKYDTDKLRIEYFKKHPEELSFITAIELNFNIDLSEFYN